MGKGKKVTVGYWYHPAFHAGLGVGPIDAFLEFIGGSKTAWAGELTASGSIYVDAPELFGGEKDQGGIVGYADVMFGEATQMPSGYLASTFGGQQPAWRGMTTFVWKNGKYGAMNPYPQPARYKIRKIKQGWADGCWYESKAAVPISDVLHETPIGAVYLDANTSSMDGSGVGYDFTLGAPGNLMVRLGAASDAWSYTPSDDYNLTEFPRTWTHMFGVRNLTTGTYSTHWVSTYLTAAEARAAHAAEYVSITLDAGEYRFYLYDAEVDDNRGFGSYALSLATASYAMNPAHILYYSRTQPDMAGEPTSAINDASFTAAADWFFAQGFGLCTSYDPSAESVDEFEQRICRVAGCSLSRSLIDGQWYIDIANGEYDIESLPILGDDDILAFEEQPTILDGATNSVSIKYFDPEKKEAIVTPPVQAPALIQDFGTIHKTIDFQEIPTATLAARVAQRELQAAISAPKGYKLSTTRAPYAWRPGTYFRLQLPKRGIADMVCYLAEKSAGTLKSGAMSITATQDVYGLPATSFVSVEPGVDTSPDQTPQPITLQAAFEAPYTEVCAALPRAELDALPPDIGYLMAVAADPSVSRDYALMVDDGAGYEQRDYGDWCATALVVEAAGYTDTAFTLSGGVRLSLVVVGQPALWGTEIVRVDAIDTTAGTLTLGRACADTVPAPHAAGERIWFWQVGAAYDVTEYTDGETISVKLLTNTGSQRLPIASATAMSLTFDQRQFRPYPPAKFRVNTAADPAYLFGALTVTWVHRDRVLQADQLLDTEAATVGPEAGTTYTMRTYLDGTLDDTQTGITGTSATVTPSGDGRVRIEVESVRDSVTSLQMQVREFDWTATEMNPLLLQSGAIVHTQTDDPIYLQG